MNYREIIESKGLLLLSAKGPSMLPFIRPNSDIVKLISFEGPFKKYQVVLFQKGSDYILHRIIKVTDSNLICRGDNEFTFDLVKPSDVIAIMDGLFRNEKYIPNHRFFRMIMIRFWHISAPLRRTIKKLVNLLRSSNS